MRLKIVSLAAAVAVAVLLYAFLVASGFSVYSEGVALTCHLDPGAATKEAGGHIVRVTDDDLAGLPKAKRMLDLALGHGPVMHGDSIIVLDSYLNSYRVSGHPIDDFRQGSHQPVVFRDEPVYGVDRCCRVFLF